MEMKDYYLRNEWLKYLQCKHMMDKCRMDMRYYNSMMDYHRRMCMYLDGDGDAPPMPGYESNYMPAPPWSQPPYDGMYPGMGQGMQGMGQFPMMPLPFPLSPEMMMPAGSGMSFMQHIPKVTE